MSRRRVLATFPGKHGDILWALPTVRAISEVIGEPVDLLIAGQYGGLVPLIQRQPYIGCVTADPAWVVENTAPMTPIQPPPGTIVGDYDQIVNLGYRWWPKVSLPYETLDCAVEQWPEKAFALRFRFDLFRPWITPLFSTPAGQRSYAIAFTEEHFELKYGLTKLLERRANYDPDQYPVNLSTSPRWKEEGGVGGYSWDQAAAWLASLGVVLACNSALHVLARAVGAQVVMMEPNEQRHNEIFWPYGRSGRGVEQVIGGDGKWTWDARHTWETLCRVLQNQPRKIEELAPPASSDRPPTPNQAADGSDNSSAGLWAEGIPI